MTVADVLAAPAGPERDAAIDDWCRASSLQQNELSSCGLQNDGRTYETDRANEKSA